MRNGALPIFWQGQPVGRINDPKVDMFHLYGQWVTESSAIASQFLEAVRAQTDDSEDFVWVTWGSGVPESRGTVEFLGGEPPFPGEQIEITLRL